MLQSWPDGGPKLLWQVSGIGQGYSSPIVVADRVYITGDQDKELAISAFTLEGQPCWRIANGEPWKNPYPGARSSCTYDDGKLYHMNAHGRLVWVDAATMTSYQTGLPNDPGYGELRPPLALPEAGHQGC